MQRELSASPETGLREHVVEPKSPLSDAPLENVTVPPGLPFVPTSVSSTVALHWLPWLIATGVAQTTVVEVERSLAVTVSSSPLATWLLSPPYEPVIVEEPVAEGV
jgi:hypothetical protein